MTYQHAARAHTNIALIKYWGKADDDLIIPLTSSLSLTLDALYTDTQVTFSKNLHTDSFYLDDKRQTGDALTKVVKILNLVREQAKLDLSAEVISYNHVPTAAGLASSASGIAALAAASSRAAGLQLSDKDLSRLARRGSGSASRSIYGGLVEWQAGSDDATSYAFPVDKADWGLGMFIIINNRHAKKISSRLGMKRTVDTSVFLNAWVASNQADLLEMKAAISAHDFKRLGELTESSAYKMHATTMGATPPFTYLEANSLKALALVTDIRMQGIPAYATMDAGPNVKVLIQPENKEKVADILIKAFGREQIIYSAVGPGIQDIPLLKE